MIHPKDSVPGPEQVYMGTEKGRRKNLTIRFKAASLCLIRFKAASIVTDSSFSSYFIILVISITVFQKGALLLFIARCRRYCRE